MRRQSRELALQILFQTEFAPQIRANDLIGLFEEGFDAETVGFAQELVEGVNSNKAAIDAKIQSASHHWKLDRMAGVDRNILRVAVLEMKFVANPLKSNIIINEAVEIAKKYGTSESASFVNGLLDSISRGL